MSSLKFIAQLVRIALSCLVPVAVIRLGPTTVWTLVAFAVSIVAPACAIFSSGFLGEFHGGYAPAYGGHNNSDDGLVGSYDSFRHNDDSSSHSTHWTDSSSSNFSYHSSDLAIDSFSSSTNIDGTTMIGDTGLDVNGHTYGSTS